MNLRPPIKNIDDLHKEWSEDTIIRPDDVNLELLKIPNLHGKYLNILSYHRRTSRKCEMEFKLMKETRRAYYNGELNNPQDLEELGWEPYQFTKPTHAEMEKKLDSDRILNRLLLKKQDNDEIVAVCESILKNLHNRSWDLKTYVDYLKYQKGM